MKALVEAIRERIRTRISVRSGKTGRFGNHRFRLNGMVSPEWATSLHKNGERLCVFLIELENFFLLSRWYGEGVVRLILSAVEEGFRCLGSEHFLGTQYRMEPLEPGKYMLVCPPELPILRTPSGQGRGLSADAPRRVLKKKHWGSSAKPPTSTWGTP